ncbi:hypothetical protein ADEAN_000987300 [Angomonas deanei]|uniref:HTH myb-type domain-containing protein n=1 Tax=Angomonas deanei TaxID=59799 RepID=A0A7G2CSN3_9TRYP|nr:hypothetical protein ADEAN_000987300 [Angomonas deanei]
MEDNGPTDIHYFDHVHEMILNLIQNKNFDAIPILMKSTKSRHRSESLDKIQEFIQHIDMFDSVLDDALYWETCTYHGGLVATLLYLFLNKKETATIENRNLVSLSFEQNKKNTYEFSLKDLYSLLKRTLVSLKEESQQTGRDSTTEINIMEHYIKKMEQPPPPENSFINLNLLFPILLETCLYTKYENPLARKNKTDDHHNHMHQEKDALQLMKETPVVAGSQPIIVNTFEEVGASPLPDRKRPREETHLESQVPLQQPHHTITSDKKIKTEEEEENITLGDILSNHNTTTNSNNATNNDNNVIVAAIRAFDDDLANRAPPPTNNTPNRRQKRKRVAFTQAEDDAIIAGVAHHGQKPIHFDYILQQYRSVWEEGRTARKLYDHWRESLKFKVLQGMSADAAQAPASDIEESED